MPGERQFAAVGGQDEAPGLPEDDSIARKVEGELFAGVDHLAGAEVDVHRAGPFETSVCQALKIVCTSPPWTLCRVGVPVCRNRW